MFRMFALLSLTIFLHSCKSKKASVSPKWTLAQKKLYSNVFTKEGYPDTAFVKIYRFEGGVVADSVEGFIHHVYDGKALIEKNYFQKTKGQFVQSGSIKYRYDQQMNLIYVGSFRSGQMLNESRFTFDESGKKKEALHIFGQGGLDATQDDVAFTTQATAVTKFDTLKNELYYNANGEIEKVLAKGPDGTLLNEEVTLYSGKTPVAAYTYTPAGDTIQRMVFFKEKSYDKVTVSTDKVKISRWTYKSWLMASVTEDLISKARSRSIYTYDRRGQLLTQKLYEYTE